MDCQVNPRGCSSKDYVSLFPIYPANVSISIASGTSCMSYMPVVLALSLHHPPVARMESVSKRSHKLMKPALPYIPLLLKAMQDPWCVIWCSLAAPRQAGSDHAG